MPLFPDKNAWNDYPDIIRGTLLNNKIKAVLEIGAGPNPSLDPELVSSSNIEYHLNDESATELRKGKNNYTHFTGDFSSGIIPSDNYYGLILSKMVLEHIPNPEAFHSQAFQHLKPGGFAIHFFATLYSIPAVLNKVLPDVLSNVILKWGQNRDAEYHGKFPAMYKWCRGPVKGFSDHFEDLGYKVIEHRGYLGHGYLSSKKYLWPIEKNFSKMLLRLNKPLFCSNAILVLQKPLKPSP